MDGANLQPTTPNVNNESRDGVQGVAMSSDTDFAAPAPTQTTATTLSAVVTMPSASTAVVNTSVTEVPYDLLLDDELNGFFDDEDAISTSTDEGGMGYYFDKKSIISNVDSVAAPLSGTGVESALSDAAPATAERNEVDTQKNIRGLVKPTATTVEQQQVHSNSNQILRPGFGSQYKRQHQSYKYRLRFDAAGQI